jgi:hypothetical protein
MPRSSESVAALAGALAKAQSELINPEKSLVATLPAERGQPERTFRYAPLSGGLEIVRKILGRHEIATIQSTAIDRDSGIINLTTTLAHVSGEWIASDWPVCGLAELPTPHRMGAALTYARRYALFTLVGIAGEDDLDAPELPILTLNGGGIARQASPDQTQEPAAPSQVSPARAHHERTQRRVGPAPAKPVLTADASAAVRDQLLGEITGLVSADGLNNWARRCLPAKNTLTSIDAILVEEAFGRKLSELAGLQGQGCDAPLSEFSASSNAEESPPSSVVPPALGSTSVLEFEDYDITPKPRRRRDKRHLRFVSTQPCSICGRQPSDPHHLRFAQPRGLGIKVSDEFTVPLCRSHHRELHRTGEEAGWWKQFSVDPMAIAYQLWTSSHPVRKSAIAPNTVVEAVAPALDSSVGAPETATANANSETNPIQLLPHDVV